MRIPSSGESRGADPKTRAFGPLYQSVKELESRPDILFADDGKFDCAHAGRRAAVGAWPTGQCAIRQPNTGGVKVTPIEANHCESIFNTLTLHHVD
jgi:hypothetical protein